MSLELGNSAAFGGILMRILGLSIQSLAFLLFMLHDFQFSLDLLHNTEFFCNSFSLRQKFLMSYFPFVLVG